MILTTSISTSTPELVKRLKVTPFQNQFKPVLWKSLEAPEMTQHKGYKRGNTSPRCLLTGVWKPVIYCKYKPTS